ncbi:MAG: hypothetical protein NZM42_09270, partial [Gemmatales bacterium]|nr:hypothetical protein [Gemmatales bacterium]
FARGVAVGAGKIRKSFLNKHLRNITALPFGADPRAKPPIYENSLLSNFAVGVPDPLKCALRCALATGKVGRSFKTLEDV